MPRKKNAKEPVGVIMRRPRPADVGDHLLFIHRPTQGLFGQGGTAIFAVTGLSAKDGMLRAETGFGPLWFDQSLPYLCIPRALCKPVTIQELADLNIEEKKEWAEAYKDMPADSEVPEVSSPTVLPGHYL